MNISVEQLKEVIEKVRGIRAIVEGKRDKTSLQALGFSSIEMLDRPLFEVVERFEPGERVQILTDLDKEGRQLYGKLYTALTRRGVKVDTRMREALFDTELTHIEGFASYLVRQS